MKRVRLVVQMLVAELLVVGCPTNSVLDDAERPSTDGATFYLATRLDEASFNIPEQEQELRDPSFRLLIAACRNYADWLADRSLDTNIIILDQDGLLNSASLLSGSFADSEAALEAEEIFLRTGEDDEAANRLLAELYSNSPAELGEALDYLATRNGPLIEEAAERFTAYVINLDLDRIAVVREEVPERVPLIDPPFLTRTGLISVKLNDGTIVGIPEERCWNR